MNRSQALRIVGTAGGFCFRHGLAFAITVAAACIAWTVLYLILLLWAILWDQGVGGPLAYPAGLVFFFLAAVVVGLVVLFPACALAEWIARSRGWPVLVQIPLSVGVLAVLCGILVAVVDGVSPSHTIEGGLLGFGSLFLGSLLPLGVYWWAAQGGPLLLSGMRWVRTRLTSARKGDEN